MPSWSAQAIRMYIEYMRRSKQAFGDAQNMRKSIHDLYLHPQSFCPPTPGPDITVDRQDVDDWPLYRVSPAPIREKDETEGSRSAMLYVHGGAFCREIDQAHWTFIFSTARNTGLDIFVPIYPLVPRPTATAKQVINALVELCRNIRSIYKHDIVNITGDSAGGCIALATMYQILDDAPELAEKITSIVLISPVLDISFSHPETLRTDKEGRDPWLGVAGLQVITPLWSAGLSTLDTMASPLYGNVARLPPVLLLSGTDDLLNSDARRLSAKFQGKDDGKCIPGSVQLEKFTYIEEPQMIHVYPLLPCWEGGQARSTIEDFIRSHIL
ncbi:hypothetical protein E8E13_002467 [Curvularia kusanoi]|uniref:Alpha/beta hydrolase fold-3 domain-containing protein n=1 Tax=Curvularia kusanoi TaxID=90978 RepID=A0A9P4T5D0_CURKU|nr:hypothetical protein E8E13_002467 [Curvularia kusanoi]